MVDLDLALARWRGEDADMIEVGREEEGEMNGR